MPGNFDFQSQMKMMCPEDFVFESNMETITRIFCIQNKGKHN